MGFSLEIQFRKFPKSLQMFQSLLFLLPPATSGQRMFFLALANKKLTLRPLESENRNDFEEEERRSKPWRVFFLQVARSIETPHDQRAFRF